jgi:hypothetical protein
MSYAQSNIKVTAERRTFRFIGTMIQSVLYWNINSLLAGCGAATGPPISTSSDPNKIIALAEFVDRVLFHNNDDDNNNNHDSDTATATATNVQNDNEL